MVISPQSSEWISSTARKAIEFYMDSGSVPLPEILGVPDFIKQELNDATGFFVILKKRHPVSGEVGIRGMMGALSQGDALWKSVANYAITAAFFDPRTPRLKPYELNEVTIDCLIPHSFSQQSNSFEEFVSLLEMEHPGVMALYNNREAFMLPYVWQEFKEAPQLLRVLLLQLGIPVSLLQDNSVNYQTFSVTSISSIES